MGMQIDRRGLLAMFGAVGIGAVVAASAGPSSPPAEGAGEGSLTSERGGGGRTWT